MFRILTLVVAVALSAAWASAESLGEVARRERERRASLGKHSRVLTNEDLKRPRILAPGPGKQVSRARRELMPLGDHTFSSRPPGLFSSRPPGLVADPRVPPLELSGTAGLLAGRLRSAPASATRRPGRRDTGGSAVRQCPAPSFSRSPCAEASSGTSPGQVRAASKSQAAASPGPRSATEQAGRRLDLRSHPRASRRFVVETCPRLPRG